MDILLDALYSNEPLSWLAVIVGIIVVVILVRIVLKLTSALLRVGCFLALAIGVVAVLIFVFNNA